MVSKRHALGALEAGLVFELGGDFNFLHAGADEGENVIEEFAADQRGFVHELQLVFVLDEAERLDKGAASAEGKLRRSLEGSSARKRARSATVVCRVEAGKLSPGLRGQPLDGGDGGWAGDDLRHARLSLLRRPGHDSGRR